MKLNKKIKISKSKIQNSMILNIKHYSNSNYVYKFDEHLRINKANHKIGLKYFSYPALVSLDKPPGYIIINIDIIENDITKNNVLKVVKINNNREISCDSPQYYNLNDSYINKIKITYLDENGRYIKFDKAYIYLDLEIIKI